MLTVDLGAPAVVGIELRDSTGTLANATGMTCTVTLPDGTTTAATVTNPSTGLYTATLSTTTQVGDHVAYFASSGANTDTAYRVFTVEAAGLFDLDELATLLDVTADATRAVMARHCAHGLIRSYCRQNITRSTYTASLPVEAGSDGYYVVRLPQRPVFAVSSVTVNGTAYTSGTDYSWDGVSDHVRLAYREWSTAAFQGEPRAVVAYTAGYVAAPAAVRAVALSVAARAYDNPSGLRSESIDDYSATRAGTDDDLAGITLTAAEKAALKPYRLTAGSLVLR